MYLRSGDFKHFARMKYTYDLKSSVTSLQIWLG